MVHTTRQKKGRASGGRGSRGNRGRSGRGGISTAASIFLSTLFVAICGAGFYFYKNGVPSDWNLFSADGPAAAVAETEREPHPKVAEEGSRTAQDPMKQVVQKPSKEKSAVQQGASEKKQGKTPTVESSKVAAKQNKEHKKSSKFVQPSYTRYHQSRWGYDVVFPSFLTQEIYSENNDGCHFADYSGTEFISYGSWNIAEATIRELYREKLDDSMKVTYKRLYREKNYFIKFGYTEDGRMFYMKRVIAKKLDGAPVITGILYFRPELKEGSEEVIHKMFDQFPY